MERRSGVARPLLWMAHAPGLRFDGDRDTFASGANRPKRGAHSKYLQESRTSHNCSCTYRITRDPSVSHLFPSTEPSFFPRGSSNSTPAQTPEANSVTPTYRKVPALLPLLLDTMTLSPMRRSPLVVVEMEASTTRKLNYLIGSRKLFSSQVKKSSLHTHLTADDASYAAIRRECTPGSR